MTVSVLKLIVITYVIKYLCTGARSEFNTFLTLLSLLSLVVAYYVVKQQRWALVGSVTCGLSYFLVYSLDLGHLFPVSPDAMPTALLTIELLGTLLSLPLVLLSGQTILQGSEDALSAYPAKDAITFHWKTTGQRITLALVFVLVAFSIITFATRSAMGLTG